MTDVAVLESLEKYLTRYEPEISFTNISTEDLRTSVTDSIAVRVLRFVMGGEKKESPAHHIYFFFPKTDDSIDIKVNGVEGLFVPLDPKKYGFSDSKTVKLSPTRLDADLSGRARELYEGLVCSDEISLNELLESAGYIVNSSVEYDIDEARRLEIKHGGDGLKWDEYKQTYQPTGEEVMKGRCEAAGNIIRGLLFSLGIEDRFLFTRVNAANGITTHDTTLVFDRESGEWAVINSKSPIKTYNLVPEEKLTELGRPYVNS